MEGNKMALIVVLLAFAVVLCVAAGIMIGTNPKSANPVALFVMVVVCFVGAGALFNKYYSPLKADLSGNYLVKDKLVATATARKFYILYSVKEERERLAELSEYPPKGYKETIINGIIMLIPEVKQK